MYANKAHLPLLFAACALSFAAAGVTPALAQRTVTYTCEDGARFKADYSSSGDQVTLRFRKNRKAELKTTASPSGVRYSGAGFVFHEHGARAVFVRPGNEATKCRAGGAGPAAAPARVKKLKPSFECGPDNTRQQRVICSNRQLAGLDNKMARAYRKASAKMDSAGRGQLRREQLAFVRQRRSCRTSRPCLVRIYNTRIAMLEGGDTPFGPQIHVQGATTGGQALSCATEPGLQSKRTRVLTTITFRNLTRSTLRIFWVTYQGQRKFHADLPAGRTMYQRTYAGHPWVVTDTRNSCLGVYLPSSSSGAGMMAVIR
jgi:uncharacterized protein